MALVANYYYCDGSTRITKSVTLTVGSELQYFAGSVGDCYVTKKRRKITASFVGAATETLRIRYSYWYEFAPDFYDPIGENNVAYTVNDYIDVNAGSTSAYEYIDTYVKSDCVGQGEEFPDPL